MIELGGKSQLVLTQNCSKKSEQNFLNFTFLHLAIAIFSLVFNPFLNSHSDITNTITLSVGNAWLGLADSTVQSAQRISDSSGSKTDDKAKAANSTAASAQIGTNALQAIVTAPSFGFYGAVTDTLSKATTTSETDYVQSKLTSNTKSSSYSLGGNIGFNNSSLSQDRLWTDNVASIIGTNNDR